jgi:prepilin-type N-terminal cleavage/methylation domain-containing protein
MKSTTPHFHNYYISRGFTLVELLVVITIIAAMAALAISVTVRMRDQAHKVNSARNVSQLQVANASYAADHNGNYVPIYAYDDQGKRIGFWYQNQDYLGNLIGDILDANGERAKNIPSSSLDPKVVRAKKGFHHSIAASYGMNDNGIAGVHGPNVAPAHNLNRISNPSEAMAFATATDYRISYGSRFKWKGVDGKTSDGALAYRYNDKALIVYFDGHVSEVSQEDLRKIDASQGGNSGRFWNPRAN